MILFQNVACYAPAPPAHKLNITGLVQRCKMAFAKFGKTKVSPLPGATIALLSATGKKSRKVVAIRAFNNKVGTAPL